jgi:hypothetical protein
MALVVELYCGEVGASDGVKHEDQVLVTRTGVKVLVPSPRKSGAIRTKSPRSQCVALNARSRRLAER